MSRVSIGKASYQISADTSGLTKGVEITRREISKANRILEQTKPAAQKLTEQMQLLERAFKAGAISAEQYNVALGRLQQKKAALSQASSQLAGVLRSLPLPGVAADVVNLATQLQTATVAAKAFMLSVGGLATLGIGAGIAAFIAVLQLAQKHQEQLKNAEDARARAALAAAEKINKASLKRFDQDLELLRMINDEQQKANHLADMRSKIEADATQQNARRHEIVAKDAAILERLREIAREANERDGITPELREERRKLREERENLQSQLEVIENTNAELERQLEILEDLEAVDEQREKKIKDIERQNQFLRDQANLQERLARAEAEAAGIDLDRQRSLEGLTDERRAELQALYDQIDAQEELNRKHKELVKDIEDSIRAHEKETDELKKQAEAIKDRQRGVTKLDRDLAMLERMGMEGLLDPDELAAAIAEAVGDAMREQQADPVTMDIGSAALINFMQKLGREQAQQDIIQTAILQAQTAIQTRIANAAEAQARALAGLGLVD